MLPNTPGYELPLLLRLVVRTPPHGSSLLVDCSKSTPIVQVGLREEIKMAEWIDQSLRLVTCCVRQGCSHENQDTI